jgi:hypothetical protein
MGSPHFLRKCSVLHFWSGAGSREVVWGRSAFGQGSVGMAPTPACADEGVTHSAAFEERQDPLAQ